MRTLSPIVLSLLLCLGAACSTTGPRAGGPDPAPPPPDATPAPPTPTPPPQSPAPAPPADAWYEPEIRAFEESDRASPPPAGQVLFIGSSSARMWTSLARDMAPAPVLNRGFGGSKTAEVLEVFNRIVLPYEPSVIVYYCGDNDLGTDNHDWESAANGFIAFDRLARSIWPKVRVFNLPIKPSLARWGNWESMRKANDMVREYCEATPGATYLDTVTPMLGPDGTPDPSLFLQDGLHLNDAGYALWTRVVRDPVVGAWRQAGE
ncbi:MAG: hypothetical protein IT431_02015 [Phycisphaerales bacterium]|nr:hypothetical protein [Phycisphaerales bacterium]